LGRNGHFADSRPVEVYDSSSRHWRETGFFLSGLHSAKSVVDAGSDAAELLHGSRAAGQVGRLGGLTPPPFGFDQALTETSSEIITIARRTSIELVAEWSV